MAEKYLAAAERGSAAVIAPCNDEGEFSATMRKTAANDVLGDGDTEEDDDDEDEAEDLPELQAASTTNAQTITTARRRTRMMPDLAPARRVPSGRYGVEGVSATLHLTPST